MKVTQISDGKDLRVDLMDYGARIIGIYTDQQASNIVCGYSSNQEYLNDSFYMGATIGPIANRIKNAKLSINNEPFILPANEGSTCLHSGGVGFDREFWSLQSTSSNCVEYKLVYDLKKVGMRGILTTVARYIAKDNALHIEYESRCDTTSYINVSNHVYLNLSQSQSAIDDHRFTLFAKKFAIKDQQNNSNGEVQSIQQPFEFSLKDDSQFKDYVDQHFIVKENEANTDLNLIVHAVSDKTNIEVEVLTSSPGFHFYTGYFLKEPFVPSQGFCIETQTIPNAINLSEFDAPLLQANELRIQKTIFKFAAPS